MKKKKLSQNFLIDENIKKNILKKINIKKKDIIVEIGAGSGELSKSISNLTKKAFFIEIDKNLVKNIEKKLDSKNELKIYNDDILKFNLKDIIKKYKKIRLIGNIPYKITSKILKIIENISEGIKDAHLIIQKEVADKLINKQKESCSKISLNFKFNIKKVFDINPSSFNPKPKVTSSFITLEKKKNTIYLSNKLLLKEIIKNAFKFRRKNIIKTIINIKKIKKYINLNKRPENISIYEFIRITNFINIIK